MRDHRTSRTALDPFARRVGVFAKATPPAAELSRLRPFQLFARSNRVLGMRCVRNRNVIADRAGQNKQPERDVLTSQSPDQRPQDRSNLPAIHHGRSREFPCCEQRQRRPDCQRDEGSSATGRHPKPQHAQNVTTGPSHDAGPCVLFRSDRARSPSRIVRASLAGSLASTTTGGTTCRAYFPHHANGL